MSKGSKGSRPKKQRAAKNRRRAYRLFGVALLTITALFLYLLPNGREYRTKNPSTTSLMNSRAKKASAEGKPFSPRLTWCPLKDMSPAIPPTIVMAEDGRFYDHFGLDGYEIWYSIKLVFKKLKLRGASTITQQLAKNLYLSESKNPLRKLVEAVITLKMEAHLSKHRILEIYLNVIEWGEGIFGINEAAKHYFGKGCAEINQDEAAFLAAIIPSPKGAYNPSRNPRKVAARKELILSRLRKGRERDADD